MNDTSIHKIELVNLLTNEVYELQVPAIIGRHEDCDFVLAGERGASRKHARVTVEDGLVVLMDLGSLNGTMVNGHEINRPVQLADGDIVLFDKQEFRFALSSTTSDVSENVTVIANKEEIGDPASIKPAIQILDEEEAAPYNSTDIQDTSPAQDHMHDHIELDNFDNIHDEPIAATSRPGGHTPSKHAQRQANQSERKNPLFRLLLVLSTLVLLILYIAYINGYQFPRLG